MSSPRPCPQLMLHTYTSEEGRQPVPFHFLPQRKGDSERPSISFSLLPASSIQK